MNGGPPANSRNTAAAISCNTPDAQLRVFKAASARLSSVSLTLVVLVLVFFVASRQTPHAACTTIQALIQHSTAKPRRLWRHLNQWMLFDIATLIDEAHKQRPAQTQQITQHGMKWHGHNHHPASNPTEGAELEVHDAK